MLFGRRRECEVLDRLLVAARSGHGTAIVLHGEPGVGKTALLEYAITAAQGFQVLRTVGNEAEMELPSAALQQLCAPGVASLEQLPEPQRDALRVAFGLMTGATPDRLLVGLAVLNLLSQLAAQRPLLCVVDDAQWLDGQSAQAFAFVARRLVTEPIAVMFGARGVTDEFRGLPQFIIEGLGESAAMALLRSVLPERFDQRVLERLVAETHGNPLALLELPRGLTPSQLAGGFALPVSVPLAGRIEASFRRRLVRLPAQSRRLLLVAAAEPTGDPVLVWRAAEQLGVDDSAAAAVEAEGLVELNTRVVFRHPLVRSAIYRAASPEERRQAHRALAEATDAAVDPDRRAWHRSQATSRPDDEVAADLELSAGRAQARGGFAAAAAFMQRSAELTVDSARRAGRALVAAEAKRQAGALDAALALATVAARGPLDDSQQAQLDLLRAQISFASNRGNDAPLLLLKAAQRLEPHDVTRARETYLDAMTAALFAGRLANGCSARDVAKTALAAPPPLGPARASDLLLDGLAHLIADGPASGTAVVRQALDAFRGQATGTEEPLAGSSINTEEPLTGSSISTEERLRWSWLAGRAAAFIWDYDSWDALTARQVQVANDAGALTVLPLTLSTRAGVHLFAGELSVAASLVEQVEAVADATDTRTARYAAVTVAAFRGREHDARQLIDTNAQDFASRGEGMGVTVTQWAAALLYNGLARYHDAFAAAEQALEDPLELWFSPWATVELIEAASRTGRAVAAASALERLAEGTSASGTAWAGAIEDRSRALLSEGAVAETRYRDALDRLAPTALRLDLARTHLVYGEWLRRERRHVDAREQLRLAHGLFTEFGMEGFAERARVELRATGEHARKRATDTSNDLTPQERQISQLVAQGRTNLEIAAQLFISPSTVEYHLHKIFRKLGVKSRTQLARHVLESSPRAIVR
ncbi:MAG TPA: LuxR C-terminal-related transcriptional regulator [Pseudonocardiaceae bacterium]